MLRTDMINRITDTMAGVTAQIYPQYENKKYEATARRIVSKESVPRTLELFRDRRKIIPTNITETTAGVRAQIDLPFENKENENPANTTAINTSQ